MNADLEAACTTCTAQEGQPCYKTIARSGRRIELDQVHASRRSAPWRAYRFREPLILRERKDGLLERLHPMGAPELLDLGDLADEVEEDQDTPVCRKCGCRDDLACDAGCFWIEEDLCSSCLGGT